MSQLLEDVNLAGPVWCSLVDPDAAAPDPDDPIVHGCRACDSAVNTAGGTAASRRSMSKRLFRPFSEKIIQPRPAERIRLDGVANAHRRIEAAAWTARSSSARRDSVIDRARQRQLLSAENLIPL